MKTKKIIAITTITSIAAAGLASAQTVENATQTQKSILQQAMSLFQSGKTDEAKTLLSQSGYKPFENKDGNGRMHGKMHARMKGHGMGDRKAIEDTIVSGSYTQFQKVASSSPLKNISLEVFNKLVPQFQAKQAAEKEIRNILSAAGIQPPQK